MEPWWLQALLTLAGGFLASTGFWAFVQSRSKSKDAAARLLRVLAYDKIMKDGVAYLDRGYISRDELEDLNTYLFEPYKEFGGNGVAEQIMRQIHNLPIRSPIRYSPTNGGQS